MYTAVMVILASFEYSWGNNDIKQHPQKMLEAQEAQSIEKV